MSLPVIAVTASSKVGEEMELQSQFSGYIRKPFSRQRFSGAGSVSQRSRWVD